MTDAQDKLELSIGMYDYDDSGAISFPDNWADGENIYAVIWVGDSSDIAEAQDNTPWAVININEIRGKSTPYKVNGDDGIVSFNTQPWGGGDTSFASLTEQQRSKIKVRVIHSNEDNAKSLGGLKNIAQHQSYQSA